LLDGWTDGTSCVFLYLATCYLTTCNNSGSLLWRQMSRMMSSRKKIRRSINVIFNVE
jgi:hypothetical protein